MKLVILEGPVDLQFFKWFVLKQLRGQDISKKIIKENKELISMFKNLLRKNPEMARVDFLSLSDEILVLLSVGGKDNFEKVAEGIRGLVDALFKRGEDIKSIVFVGDKDAEHNILKAKNITEKNLSKIKRKINVYRIICNDYLEDVVLELVGSIKTFTETTHIQKDLEVLENLLKIIEEKYSDDDRVYKRKLSIVHAIIGPGCYRELFENLFEFFDNSDRIMQSFDVLDTFSRLLKE